MNQETKHLSCAETAKLVRRALKKAFPTQKFNVRHMRASISVRWTDGPSLESVEAIAHDYRGARYDGTIDLTYYLKHWLSPDGSVHLAHTDGTTSSGGIREPAAFPKPHEKAKLVSLGADHVSCDRTISYERKRRICQDIARKIGREFKGDFYQNIFDNKYLTWQHLLFRLTKNADLTTYNGIVKTGNTSGQSPDDFYRVVT